MGLEIGHRELEGIDIFDLKGRFRLGEEDLTFRTELDQLVERGKFRLAVNLAGMIDIDTTGLGTLASTIAALQKKGGGLVLFNLNPAHIELLVLTELETKFEVFEDEQNAIDSFFPDRELKRYDILEFVRTLREKQEKP
jgi:anti-sigma B factor antagonist